MILQTNSVLTEISASSVAIRCSSNNSSNCCRVADDNPLTFARVDLVVWADFGRPSITFLMKSRFPLGVCGSTPMCHLRILSMSLPQTDSGVGIPIIPDILPFWSRLSMKEIFGLGAPLGCFFFWVAVESRRIAELTKDHFEKHWLKERDGTLLATVTYWRDISTPQVWLKIQFHKCQKGIIISSLI